MTFKTCLLSLFGWKFLSHIQRWAAKRSQPDYLHKWASFSRTVGAVELIIHGHWRKGWIKVLSNFQPSLLFMAFAIKGQRGRKKFWDFFKDCMFSNLWDIVQGKTIHVWKAKNWSSILLPVTTLDSVQSLRFQAFWVFLAIYLFWKNEIS